MSQFENIHFHGTFRSYQKRVLDNADKYLKDGKINIVAAPGSGKTVLGLELIRKLGSPCIILSPTTAIREQWAARFKDLFLDDRSKAEALFSTNLHSVKLINSITYQALYSAIEKASQAEEDDVDYSDIDLFQTIKEHNIKTICLDEAHHLKNEWQRALERFIEVIESDVIIISLTATPPYDSDGSEWNRYINICGEIDEEIFVPELVAQNTLCPHQDYIYFNYPTKEEISILNEYKQHAFSAAEEIASLSFMYNACEQINSERDYGKLITNAKEYIALCIFLSHFGFYINRKTIRVLTDRRDLPYFNMQYAETAIQFLLNGNLVTDEQKEEIRGILRKYSVYDKRKTSLVLNDKLKRTLVSSVGKLESIKCIAANEYKAMGSDLRMLILTDYIKKENVGKIATEEEFNSVNIVSIFETLRRANDALNIGVLSGTLVILPDSADFSLIKHKKQIIPGTRYCTVELSGSNHDSVEFVGKLFEQGILQVLIGTKSLLGEGWDSPCINSLILASFVGSFVLSNQMRGRAIRIDKSHPDKSANIWHLVTVEPEYIFKENIVKQASEFLKQDNSELTSYDFETLKRRFDSFMGPNYTTGSIESGIERITLVAPPYDKNGISRINQEMLTLSEHREDMKTKWKAEVSDAKFETVVENSVPNEKRVPVFTFFNMALLLSLAGLETAVINAYTRFFINLREYISWPLLAITEAVIFYAFYRVARKLLLHSNPARSIKTLGKAVFETLKECDMISSSAIVETKQDKLLSIVHLQLRNASVHDQNIFNTAMTELLSPIENPRYILVKKNILQRYDYGNSYACPSIIGRKNEYAAVLSQKLKYGIGNFEAVYTYREGGRRIILKCRKKSYITRNHKLITKKYKVSRWE